MLALFEILSFTYHCWMYPHLCQLQDSAGTKGIKEIWISLNDTCPEEEKPLWLPHWESKFNMFWARCIIWQSSGGVDQGHSDPSNGHFCNVISIGEEIRQHHGRTWSTIYWTIQCKLNEVDVCECVVHPKKLWTTEGILSSQWNLCSVSLSWESMAKRSEHFF